MDPTDFAEYVDVLRERIFDYEAVHDDGTIPDFADLMSDYPEITPKAWAVQAYEHLLALAHLNPAVSGMTMGPNAHGRLSASGRYYMREHRKR